MSDDLQTYLFEQLGHHLEKLDDLLQSEGRYEEQEYHLTQAQEIKNKLREALKRG